MSDFNCPGSVSGHWVDNVRGECEWCGRKVELSEEEVEAAHDKVKIRHLANEVPDASVS